MADDFAVDALRMHPDLVLVAELEPIAQELIVCYANPAAESLLGRPMSEILGRPLRTLLAEQPASLTPALRKAFFERMREQGMIEFPLALAVPGGNGRRRQLRMRLRFDSDETRVIAVGEDVSMRRARDDDAMATERLRASAELSQLLNHHLNNALAATLLNVEMAREEVCSAADSPANRDLLELLGTSVDGITAASQVLSALATTHALDTEVAESSDLASALAAVVASLGTGLQLSEPAEPQSANAPAWVWGDAEQLEAILSPVLAHAARHAPGDCLVSMSRDPERVSVQIRVAPRSAAAASDGADDDQDWLRPLLEPAGAYPGFGSSPVRLFASVLVLQAIGGRLELPRLHGSDTAIELCFRAAPGRVTRPKPPVRILLVSRDGALRGAMNTLLSPWPLEHGESLREGILRIMRNGGGVVICDIDSLGITVPQLHAFERAVADLGPNRLVVASRKAPLQASTPGTQLPIPFSREQLLQAIQPESIP